MAPFISTETGIYFHDRMDMVFFLEYNTTSIGNKIFKMLLSFTQMCLWFSKISIGGPQKTLRASPNIKNKRKMALGGHV